jgi:hypothetical protein
MKSVVAALILSTLAVPALALEAPGFAVSGFAVSGLTFSEVLFPSADEFGRRSGNCPSRGAKLVAREGCGGV